MSGIRCERIALPDPVGGQDVPALRLTNPSGIELIAVPSRALDIYSLRYQGESISYTNRAAGISPAHFSENGIEGFQGNFFAGMVTTCGLIQSGRPCAENGRKFGLHGCISNTPSESLTIEENEDSIIISAIVNEMHTEGERMELSRRLILSRSADVRIEDCVTNRGQAGTPFMMMYHINFGAPFLSEGMDFELPFQYVEDRDTGAAASADAARRICGEGASANEKVYYTRADLRHGAALTNRKLNIACRLTAEGEDLQWTGIWQSYVQGKYALGIEPCNCPGLGRVQAAARGLLPHLAPGESRRHSIHLHFEEIVREREDA